MAVEQVSPELKILRSQFSDLVTSISVSSILPEARDTLITVRDYEDCKAENSARQAEKLMECVERAVNADPEKFAQFVIILKKVGHKAIGDRLLDDMMKSSHRPDLKQLLTACGHLGHQWYMLGIYLGLKMSQLQSIEAENSNSMERLFVMFDMWLKSSPSASWSDLITALRAIDENSVASHIEATYLPSKGEL